MIDWTWILAAVWILPSAFAIATGFKNRLMDLIVVNFLLGWFPLVWLGLMVVVWEDWDWWRGA